MMIPMVILGVLSVIGGFYGTPWQRLDWRVPRARRSTALLDYQPATRASGSLDAVGLVLALFGIGVAWAALRSSADPASQTKASALVVAFVSSGLGIDALYDARHRAPTAGAGTRPARGRRGRRARRRHARRRRRSSALAARAARRLQTGYARNYALAIFVGAALILLYFMIFP